MTDPDFCGVVIAAGRSTRMGGFPKPLLHTDGERFVERVLATLDTASVSERVVILGYEHETVRARADLSTATAILLNEQYKDGMLSSVQIGVETAQDAGVDGLLLWPVDFPFVPVEAVRRLYDTFREEPTDIVLPVVDDERGHPTLFATSTFEALLAAPENEGARAVVYADETDVMEVSIDDERILVDIDTPEEYWRAVKRYG